MRAVDLLKILFAKFFIPIYKYSLIYTTKKIAIECNTIFKNFKTLPRTALGIAVEILFPVG